MGKIYKTYCLNHRGFTMAMAGWLSKHPQLAYNSLGHWLMNATYGPYSIFLTNNETLRLTILAQMR